jgi:hypothetical protein
MAMGDKDIHEFAKRKRGPICTLTAGNIGDPTDHRHVLFRDDRKWCWGALGKIQWNDSHHPVPCHKGLVIDDHRADILQIITREVGC